MKFLVYLLALLVAGCLSASAQSLEERIEVSNTFYNEGVSYFEKKNFRTADSLFTMSIVFYPHPDTYYNLAVCKKYQSDLTGFAMNLEHAMMLGDTLARNIYYKQCIESDTSYTDAKGEKSFFLQHEHSHINVRSKYTSYREFVKKNRKEAVVKKYIVYREDTVYVTIDSMQVVMNTHNEITQRLVKQVKYPIYEKDNRIQGTVYISFVLTKKGEISHPVVIRSPSTALSAEVVRALRATGKYSPVYYEGKPISLQLVVPVRFILQ